MVKCCAVALLDPCLIGFGSYVSLLPVWSAAVAYALLPMSILGFCELSRAHVRVSQRRLAHWLRMSVQGSSIALTDPNSLCVPRGTSAPKELQQSRTRLRSWIREHMERELPTYISAMNVGAWSTSKVWLLDISNQRGGTLAHEEPRFVQNQWSIVPLKTFWTVGKLHQRR